MNSDQAVQFATLLRDEYFSKLGVRADHSPCDDGDCDECNPITSEDVICSACGEHSEMRQETGTECCNAGSRF